MVDNGIYWTRVLFIESRQMTIVLLLLGAFVCMGLSHDSYQEKVYGDRYHVQLRRKVGLIEFIPKDSSNVTTLWKEGDPQISLTRKRIWITSYFSMVSLTQKDSGRYVMRDKNGREVATHTLEVKASTKTYERKSGTDLTFSFDLEPDSCNIYFLPDRLHQPKKKIVDQGRLLQVLEEFDCGGFFLLKPCGLSSHALQMSCDGSYEFRDQDDNTALVVSLAMEQSTLTFVRSPGERFNFTFQMEPKSCNIYFFPVNEYESGDTSIDIVRQGRLQWDHESDCTGFKLLYPCGISIEDLQMACFGRYEIADKNGNTALVVSLETQSLPNESSDIGIGIGAFLAPFFCYCVRCCCCRKSSSKENRSETAAAEPDVHYQEYDSEPVGRRPNQLQHPSETSYPTQHSYTPTHPLIHDHPTENAPPAYSEIHDHPTENAPPAYSEVSAPAEPADAPAVPVNSDPGPQFELKGMTFPSAPPLSSDSSYCAAYTSDKFNFL